jgi:hypothetical protein
MRRVNKEHRCPVCGKGDWCLRRPDGSAAICARVEQGSVERAGEAGYLHVLDGKIKTGPSTSLGMTRRKKTGPSGKVGMTIDFAKMAEEFRQRCSERQVRFLGQSLGVLPASLKRLGVGWDGEAFCFPMRDVRMNVIGIRRRLGNGRKVCVRGSRNGLFIPAGIETAAKLVVCEGPTDCAAALDLGYAAIGRPNCDSKVPMTVAYIRQRAVVIVADRDSAGMRGARKLTEALVNSGSSVRFVLPPNGTKDLRQWKQSGGRIVL